MDEVRIWNYARTQAEIQGTINSQLSTPQAGLVARWGLNEGSGTFVNEAGGTSNVYGRYHRLGFLLGTRRTVQSLISTKPPNQPVRWSSLLTDATGRFHFSDPGGDRIRS